MAEYVIYTDATNDLPAEFMKEHEVGILPMEINIGQEVIPFDQTWSDAQISAFYDRLRKGDVAVTSQISPAVYEAAFSPILQSGRDVLYVCFSSGLSGTIQSAVLAANNLMQAYPGRVVRCVDSLGATFGEGLSVFHAVRLRGEGLSVEENAKWLEAHLPTFAHRFTVDDLMFLKRGGRVSATTAILGSALQIKPVLHMDDDGHLIMTGKAQGRKASLRALAKLVQETIVEPQTQQIYIGHGDTPKDAQFLADRIREAVPVKDIHIGPISPVIGAHSGPGTIAVFFVATNR